MRGRLLALALGLLTCGTANAERLTNATIGLSIEKPDDWCVLSAKANSEDHRKAETDNPQLRDVIRKDETAPVFGLFRYRDRYRGSFAPTVKVGTRPAQSSEGQSGQQAVQSILTHVSKLLTDVKVVAAPETVSLAGRAAGHMSLTFTLQSNGAPLTIASEMWVIPRGANFVLVGASYHPDDQTDDREAVMKVVNSLQLTGKL